MSHRRQIRHATLVTALSLLGFEVTVEKPLRTARQLAHACRALDKSVAAGGTRLPAKRTAEHCATTLETLAARFRRAARQLDPKRRPS